MSRTVLKISYQGEIRRTLIEKDITYDAVIHSISEVFPKVKDYSAKYLDEEGDACTLCESTFKDFLAVACAGADAPSVKLVLKLELVHAPMVTPAAAKTFEEQLQDNLFSSCDEGSPMMGFFKGFFKGKGKGKARARARAKASAPGKVRQTHGPVTMSAPQSSMLR